MTYRVVLAATDFSESCHKALTKAVELAKADRAALHIVHSVEYVPPMDSSFGTISPFEVDLTGQMVEIARTRLEKLGRELGIPEQRLRVELGSPKVEIIRVAEEISADLIVLGSHGRHGLGLLLGSTASSVVNHAKCDVLSVRLNDEAPS